jgi:large subunit ribosomal protein L13
MKTFSAKAEDIKRSWYVIDASGRTLGRLAAKIASYLKGKHKPEYTPHVDTGDYIVVINAEKIKVTGNKMNAKLYYRHSGKVGELKTTKFADLLRTFPARVISYAVKGMLPKNPLGRSMLNKLKIYAGSEHPHAAQQPKNLEV